MDVYKGATSYCPYFGMTQAKAANRLVITHEDGPLTICTDSRAVFKGLTLWLPTLKWQNWLVSHRPLWGQAMWQDLWEIGQENYVTVYHVIMGHVPLVTPGNDEADVLVLCAMARKGSCR